MLTLWLPEGTSSLPLRPHHQLGVGGYILNAKNEILVIQEKHGITAGMKDFWKLPGGVVDPNESIAHAVEREVLEETGVRVKFQTIASVRESHQGMYGGMTDLYCVCVCVLDESVYKGEQSPVPVPQEKEIAASKWMLADEFFKLKFYSRRSLFSDLLRHAALTAQDIKGGVGSVGRQSGGAAHTKGLVYTEGAKSRTGKVRDGIYAFLPFCYLYLKWKDFFEKPTWLETAGSIVGIGGAIVMLADVTVASSPNEKSPTIVGDMAAFMGAVTMCVYLLVGRWMRKWCPIWLYMTPVAFFAALTCTVASALFEGMSWGGLGATSWFGFLSPLYILFAFYLGGGAGVGGHTLLNYLLTFLSTLVVSTSLLLEPLVGSLLGACFGLQSLPGLYTILGTPVLFAGLGMIIAGEQRRVTARKVTEQEVMSVAKKNDVEIEIS
eukprot:g995.t1